MNAERGPKLLMENILKPRVAVAALSSPLEIGGGRAGNALAELIDLLQKAGCEVFDCGIVDSPGKAVGAGKKAHDEYVDAIAFLPACWFEDYLVLDFIEECPMPLLLWPLPGMETGALCGTQQLTCYLKQLHHPVYSVFGEIEKGANSVSALKFLRATVLKRKMRRSRIGLSGQHVAGMTHTAPNEILLKKTIGSRIIPFDLPSFLEKAATFSDSDVKGLWGKAVNAAGRCSVTDNEGLDSMRVYLAMKDVVEEHKLDALTIGCYPHLMGKVCLAASLLADEGIPFACEGDINGAVGQIILTLLTGMPTHHTDFLDPTDDGAVIFTHCGSGSFSLAENRTDITLGSVRLMGQGVCALFPAKSCPVTLLSLVPVPNGYQCAVLEGEAESTEMVFPGNPVKVRFKQPVNEIIQWIFKHGIGHHWVIGYGHVAEEIKCWIDLCDGLTIVH